MVQGAVDQSDACYGCRPGGHGPQLEFVVPSIHTAITELAAAGYPGQVAVEGPGGVRQLTVEEPGGNVVLIVEFSG